MIISFSGSSHHLLLVFLCQITTHHVRLALQVLPLSIPVPLVNFAPGQSESFRDVLENARLRPISVLLEFILKDELLL